MVDSLVYVSSQFTGTVLFYNTLIQNFTNMEKTYTYINKQN